MLFASLKVTLVYTEGVAKLNPELFHEISIFIIYYTCVELPSALLKAKAKQSIYPIFPYLETPSSFRLGCTAVHIERKKFGLKGFS